jgi:hypothetical protein
MTSRPRAPFADDRGSTSSSDAADGPHAVHVFVHSTASLGQLRGCTEKEAELDFGVDRALLLARPGDVVCLGRPVEPAYLEFLNRLGLGPRAGRIVVTGVAAPLPEALARDRGALAEIRALVAHARQVVLDPFMVSPDELQLAATLAETLGRPVSVLGRGQDRLDQANLKHLARAKAVELGVPVAPGEIVELSARREVAPLREALHRQLEPTGRAIVRGSHGAAGSATFVVQNQPDSIETAVRRIAERTDNTVYLVDVMLDALVSPNVLVHIDPALGRVRCVGVSDQRLDGSLAHFGNIYPTVATTASAMIASSLRFAAWLQGTGYAGFAGFDFVEYRDRRTGHREHVLAEINARTNGAAYPMSALHRLNGLRARMGQASIEAFLSVGDLRTGLDSFASLRNRCGRLLFDPVTGRGVLPYNTGSLRRGRLRAIALGGTRAEVEELVGAWRAEIAA